MTDLTPLDEKLGEVLGLAQAAQTVTETVSKMDGAGAFRDELESMSRQAEETERRTDALVDGLEGRKTAIREKARETKSEAGEMMKSYLGGEEEALDGFEFLSMSEAGELCHWEIVGEMAQKIGDHATKEACRMGGSGPARPHRDRASRRTRARGRRGRGARLSFRCDLVGAPSDASVAGRTRSCSLRAASSWRRGSLGRA